MRSWPTAFVLVGLVSGCSTAIPNSAGQPASAFQHSTAKPDATVTANAKIKSSGQIRVALRSNAKVVVVRFRRGETKDSVRKRLHEGRGRVLLGPGSTAIKARALATKRYRASVWVKAIWARQPKPKTEPHSETEPIKAVTRAELRVAARQRVFFGHQSVGWNILHGIRAVYGSHGLSAPPILGSDADFTGRASYIAEEKIGENRYPLRKISDFSELLRGGLAGRVGIALMKFCYVDVEARTNVQSLFGRYRQAMAALKAKYPTLKLLHVTVPLTTNNHADNVARERFNSLIRRTYASTGRVFDLARVESTRPNGTRVTGVLGGRRYYALYGGYAEDEGHLNGAGSKRAASELLRVVAAAG